MDFTLPPPTRAVLGWWYRFTTVVLQNVRVNAPVADTLISSGDETASSIVTTGVAPAMVGGTIEAVCVETTPGVYRWAAIGVTVGNTYNVV